MALQPGLSDSKDVTLLLGTWQGADSRALERVLPLIYSELKAMARRSLRRERNDHTLQATALVHEAYLKLADQQRCRWQNRGQLFGVAAQLMRRVLVDHARRKRAGKRDGGNPVELEEGQWASRELSRVDLLLLEDALQRLQEIDARQARIVELRYFLGLKVEETAEALGISARTVKREWMSARAWLKREIGRGVH